MHIINKLLGFFTILLLYEVFMMKGLSEAINSILFFPGVNIFKSSLASKNPELRKPASLIEAMPSEGYREINKGVSLIFRTY